MLEPTGSPGPRSALACRAGEQAALARAEERHRLRADLHDGIGPALLGATLRLAALGRRLDGDERARTLLAAVGEDLRTCREELDRLVDGLRPLPPDGGLPAVLRRELSCFRSAPLRVLLDCPDHPDHPDHRDQVDPETTATVVRIAAEAVANAVRHSNGTVCTVRLRYAHDLELVVTDDGAGLDPAAATTEGTGLGSMRRRAETAGGSFELVSGPEGTRVVVRLPLGAAGAGRRRSA